MVAHAIPLRDPLRSLATGIAGRILGEGGTHQRQAIQVLLWRLGAELADRHRDLVLKTLCGVLEARILDHLHAVGCPPDRDVCLPVDNGVIETWITEAIIATVRAVRAADGRKQP
jgi:hypothetical protein